MSAVKAFLLLPVLLLTSCARFRVTSLSENEEFSAYLGKNGLEYPVTAGVAHEIPARAGLFKDWAVMAEPSVQRVKIFRSGGITTIITVKSEAERIRKASDFPGVKVVVSDVLMVPGRVMMGKEEDFYVENIIPSADGISASKILHFDLRGKFLHLIGRTGSPQLPFDSILWFDTDKQKNLWVFYRFLDELNLDAYSGNASIVMQSQKACDLTLFERVKRAEGHTYRCEFMYPSESGKRILYVGRVDKVASSGDRRSGFQFQYRILKHRNLETNVISTVTDSLNDPDDFPYLTYDEDSVLLLQAADSNRVRYAVTDNDGDLQYNLQIRFPGRFHEWRSTWATLSGDFYSIRIASGRYRIVHWK